MELGLGEGVRGIIQGPANVVFEKKDRVSMTDGRGYFEVPEAQAGFQVITRDLVATDLGAEFAGKAGEASPDKYT